MKNILISLIIIACLGGCTAARFTSAPIDARIDDLVSGKYPVIGIERNESSGGLGSHVLDFTFDFVDDLKKTGVFDEVDLSNNLKQPPDFIIESYRDYYEPHSAFPCGEPIHVIITLGILPAVCTITHNVSYSIRSVKSNKTVKVEYWYREKTITGLISGLYRLLTDWNDIEVANQNRVQLVRLNYLKGYNQLNSEL